MKSRPLTFEAFSKLRRLARLTPDTEVVIDGFQRSGNTFAHVAFELAQTRPVQIAHHTHAAGHVLLAARRGLPTLLAVREPRSTAISYVQYYPGVSMTAALVNYTVFYRTCLSVRQRVVVAPFDDITTDMGRVIDALNAKFGTAYDRFDHSPENVERCFAVMEERWAPYGRRIDEVVPRPSAVRAARREGLERQYDALPQWLRRMADSTYGRIVEP